MKKITILLFIGMTVLEFNVQEAKSSEPPHVVSTSPTKNQLDVLANTNVSVTFDVDMNDATINNSTFVVNARSTGLHQGTFSYDDNTVTFNPAIDFDVGEVITVVLTTGIKSSEGVALENGYAFSFTIKVNDSPGIFVLDSSYESGSHGPISIIAADLDGDGDLDLATANFKSLDDRDVSVLLNNGNGTFGSPRCYLATEAAQPIYICAADLDTDGDMDLATANYNLGTSGNISVLLNDGSASFTLDSIYGAERWPFSIFAADVNVDGDLDLITANELDQSIWVRFNDGDANFASLSIYDTSPAVRTTYAADLDGDGDLDLADTAGSLVDIRLNNGDGSFGDRSSYSTDGDLGQTIFAADFDADSDLDLASTNHNSGDVSVLLNNGNAIFTLDEVYKFGWNNVYEGFAADIDNDIDLDLIVANVNTHTITILLNKGNGSFVHYFAFPAGDYPHSVFAADLDGDGDLDLAAPNYESGNISVLLNKIPFGACLPSPADSAKYVAAEVTISWTSGADANSHDVFFGTDWGDVNDANSSWPVATGPNDPNVYKGRQTANSYSPLSLELGETYYWRIDEVNGPNVWRGNIWQFTTNHIVLGDFEDYNETDLIYDTWKDRHHDSNIGSFVYLGIDPCDPVHSGNQSMKYTYDNNFPGAQKYSEIKATSVDLDVSSDWYGLGAKALTLYFYGEPNNDTNTTEQMYVGLEDSLSNYGEVRYGDNGEDMNNIQIEEWQEWNVDLQDFNNAGVDLSDVDKVYIGFGDRDNPTEAGGSGTVFFDDVRLYIRRCIPEYRPAADLTSDCVVNYADLEIMKKQWLTFGGMKADLFEDNWVNFKDFAVLANSWLEGQLFP